MDKYFISLDINIRDDDGDSVGYRQIIIPPLFDSLEEVDKWLDGNVLEFSDQDVASKDDAPCGNINKARECDIEITEDGIKCDKYESVGFFS